MKQNFLPIALNIANERILIIGGGQSAWKKIKILMRFDAHLEVVAKVVCSEIKNSGISFKEKDYEPSDLNGVLLFYSCTNNPELDEQIAIDGRAAGVLVNVHDHPDLCQFVSPAIFERGLIRIAVSSNAQDVKESIRIRNEIKEFYTPKENNNESKFFSSKRGTIRSAGKAFQRVKSIAAFVAGWVYPGKAFFGQIGNK